MIKLIDLLKETAEDKKLPPVAKIKVVGTVRARKEQEDLIKKGYELGKDFVVVQDRVNKKMYIIAPVTK